MVVTVVLATALRGMTGGAGSVDVEADNVHLALRRLAERFPTFENRLLDDAGRVRRHVNMFVGERDIRGLGGLQTRLESGDELLIIPAVAGG
ncbi:MAG: MoaD/ThiS family protein [Armatimonadetes bacterium]|nr:MoaD/ThiS family protein [Armatimonadota bacterium]